MSPSERDGGRVIYDYTQVEPFEICSIRPPTENYSLTFRLTRNCYWNRCKFCPVYKLGAKFSRRSLGEVREDIKRAQLIDDILLDHGVGYSFSGDGNYHTVSHILAKVEEAKQRGKKRDGKDRSEEEEDKVPAQHSEELDPRLAWFLSWFKDKPSLQDSVSHIVTWRQAGARTCFLGDADSMIVKPAFLTAVIQDIRKRFPSVQRFTVYGRSKTASRKKAKEIAAVKRAGLDRVHVGLESGCDEVLGMMNKGVTAAEHIDGCIKIREAGLSCSVYVMPGLGGVRFSEQHAAETAEVLTRIVPDYVRLRTLEIFPRTPLDELRERGDFTEASEELIICEIRTMIENIDCQTEIVSDSASNLLNVTGSLPEDRNAMLHVIDSYLELSPREKLEFSFTSRLRSFTGQYGGFTRDVLRAVAPLISDGQVNPATATDQQLSDTIRLIRSKLMP
jgi:hypothetical protein